MLDASTSITLVLSGGNALGAYQAGGYEALQDRGLRPDWVVGTSTGAINGAIICGNAEDDRVSRLRAYWKPAGQASASPAGWGALEDLRRSTAATVSLVGGQPNVFVPAPRAAWWPPAPADRSLYDTRPLGDTLRRLVDFDRLNDGGLRFTAVAVDIETGQPVAFDTTTGHVESDHIRASSALPPAFSLVEIDGHLFADGGLAANLPIDVVLSSPPAVPTLCLALDLLPLAAPRPTTVGQAASRMQDLMFASQSRLALAHWQVRYTARPADAVPITVLHLAYDRQEAEVAGKAFDFSPVSVRARWDAGYADVAAALQEIADGRVPLAGNGLTVWRPPVLQR